MSGDFSIDRETADPEGLGKQILDEVLRYNSSRVGPLRDEKYVLGVRTNAQELMGGLVGVQFWNGMFVDLLWVHERCRHRGIGTRLMQRAEVDLLSRGGEVIFLSTWSFQAPAFYEKLGYCAFGKLEGMPRGSTRTWYLKYLNPR